MDNRNINGEWTKVRNDSPSRAVPLAGWWIRDSMQRRYTIPAGTSSQPGQTLTLHTGCGTDQGLTRYWGLGVTLYPNPSPGEHGDGAYLFDPQGDLRAAMTYPCLVACGHPDAGALALSADPGGDESVTVRNVAGRPVDLADKLLVVNDGFAFPFGDGAVLRPGQARALGSAPTSAWIARSCATAAGRRGSRRSATSRSRATPGAPALLSGLRRRRGAP